MASLLCSIPEPAHHLLFVSLTNPSLSILSIADECSSMGVMAHSPPNYQIIAASYPAVLPNVSDPAPIFYYAGLPPGLTLADNVNGLMNAVFSFGGATLFCELMAEMRRP